MCKYIPYSRSVVNFVNLPQQSNQHASSYRLLKFIDGRDERYTHLIDYENPDETNGESDTYHLVVEKNVDVENVMDDYYDYHHHDENEVHEKESTRTHYYNWCTPNPDTNGKVGHVVLFIPGHEGRYNQARSLAAHGIQLSRHPKNMPRGYLKSIQYKLINGTMDATTNDIQNFVYDVYTLDFNGEGSAWHVSKLYAQVDFVVKSIERLSQECGDIIMNGITIVAHSFGGIVARKAILSLHEKDKVKEGVMEQGRSFEYGSLVKNVITLASPHQFIPFVLDQNVINFHKGLEMEEKNLMESGQYQTTIVSLSGGLRDELIPHQSSYWTRSQQDETDNTIVTSVFASDVMQTRTEKSYDGAKFGMDHKCIVWCHGLLSTIRELIHVFVQSSNEPKLGRELEISRFLQQKLSDGGLDCKNFSNEFPEKSCDNDTDCGYQCRIRQKELLLRKEYGLFGSVAIEIAMSYNIRPFVLLYLLNGILYQTLISIIVDRPRFKNLIRSFHFKLPYFHGKSIDMNGMLSPTKELTILHIYGYMICPSIASFLLLYFFSRSWRASHSITVLLSFTAMSLYSALLYGLIPLVVIVTSKISKIVEARVTKLKEIEQSMPWKSYIQKQKQLLMTSIIIQAIYCIAWSRFMGIDDWVFNILAVQAHCSMVFIIFVLLNILNLGLCKVHIKFGQGKDDPSRVGIIDKQSSILLQCRMVTVLLTPTFPFFVLSKLIFFTSLLTSRGQISSLPYAQAQNKDWEESCGYIIQDQKEPSMINPYSGRYCGIASLFHDDQAMLYKCLLLYLMVFIIESLKLNSQRKLFENSYYSVEEHLIRRNTKKSS